jgi:hypothetical protein
MAFFIAFHLAKNPFSGASLRRRCSQICR